MRNYLFIAYWARQVIYIFIGKSAAWLPARQRVIYQARGLANRFIIFQNAFTWPQQFFNIDQHPYMLRLIPDSFVASVDQSFCFSDEIIEAIKKSFYIYNNSDSNRKY